MQQLALNPHARGADNQISHLLSQVCPQPPRVRSRRPLEKRCHSGASSTPACAGPTADRVPGRVPGAFNPLACGAHSRSDTVMPPYLPQSPAWGRPRTLGQVFKPLPSTPACAGQTYAAWRSCSLPSLNPHARGADFIYPLSKHSPILSLTTPACTGPISSWLFCSVALNFNPHARGTDGQIAWAPFPYLPQPPRMWGRRRCRGVA